MEPVDSGESPLFDQADVRHNDADRNSGNNIEHESLRSPTEGKLAQTTEKSKREGVVGVMSDVNEVLTASSEIRENVCDLGGVSPRTTEVRAPSWTQR